MTVKTKTVVDNTNSATLYETAERFQIRSVMIAKEASWEDEPRQTKMLEQSNQLLIAAEQLREAAEALNRSTELAYALMHTERTT